MSEEWRDVVGYEGLYQVSDAGNVRSVDREISVSNGKHKTRMYKGRIMIALKTIHGYYRLQLSRDGYAKDHMVHHLVLAAFIGSRPYGCEGCHNNGVRDDNRSPNLRWDTPKGNASDRDRHGTSNAGEKHYHSRLTDAKVAHIREMRAAGIKQISIAKEFGLSEQLVSKVIRRKSWRHV